MNRFPKIRAGLPAALLSLAALSYSQSSTPSAPNLYAIVGARIEIGDGKVLEKGTIIIRDGLIAAVAPDAAVPAGAEVLDGKGLTVYPGFIDGYTQKGYTAPKPPDSHDPIETVVGDFASSFMRTYGRSGIRPEARAVEGLSLTPDVLKPYQSAGFTTLLVAPSGADMSGLAALVNLSGQPVRDALVSASVGQVLNPSGGGSGAIYPSSLMGHIAQLRQTLLDAQWYAKVNGAYQNGASHRPPVDDSLTALQPLISGHTPAIFEAAGEYQIIRALNLSAEFGLKPIIAGAKEGWTQIDALKSAGAPVLLTLNFGKDPKPAPADPKAKPEKPVTDLDPENPLKVAERVRLYEELVKNPSALAAAGIPIALSAYGCKDTNEFFENLRKAVAAGFPRETALRALTIDSAKIFGVDRLLGTLEVGKVANVTVMTGDFVNAETKVKMLYVDGHKIDPTKGEPPSTPKFRFGGEEGR